MIMAHQARLPNPAANATVTWTYDALQRPKTEATSVNYWDPWNDDRPV
jgi:hypothetical protein